MKKIIPHLIAFFLLVMPVAALAQTSGGIEGGLGTIRTEFPSGGLTQARTVPELIRYVINLMLFFAGMIAVVFIIIGGYYYITAQGNEEQAEKGKGTLVNAIIGIVVVILSYVIINVVVNLVGRGAVR